MSEPTVYDVNDRERNPWLIHPLAFCEAYQKWLREHGIEPNDTYRTEHHVIDVPLVRVFQYDADVDGRRYVDPATGDVAVRKPFDVLTKTSPPKPEDYA